jgi:SagB-type dehydrogenase family enzyme
MTGEFKAFEYHIGTQHPNGPLLDYRHRYSPGMRPSLYKEYIGLPSVSLRIGPPAEGPSALSAIGSFSSETIAPDLSAVARILHYSAGITKTIRGYPFRAAACTGALYHIELYVVSGSIAELDAGVYHFDPQHSRLLRLREGDYRALLADAAGGNDTVLSAPTTIVYTDIYWRNAVKYQARAYRHSFWDAGTILANTLAMASSLRIAATLVMGFVDEEIARLLGIDPSEELPLGLVPLGAGAAPAKQTTSGIREMHHDWEPMTSGRRGFPIIPKIHQETSLPGADEVHAWRIHAEEEEVRRGEPAEQAGQADQTEQAEQADRPSEFPLHPPVESALPTVSLELTILRRGSSRAFTRDPIALEQLATLLYRSIRPIRTDYRRNAPLVQPYMIVNAVEGVASGVYRVLVADEEPRLSLQEIRLGEFREQAAHLALDQALAGDAAVNVYFMSDLGQALASYGERGYRLAQMEAAIMAGWGYLAAYALGIGATGLTFFDEAVEESLRVTDKGLKVMFLLTVGVPRTKPR